MTQSVSVIRVLTGRRTLRGLVAEHLSNREHPGDDVRVPLFLEVPYRWDARLLGQLQREAWGMSVQMTTMVYTRSAWVLVIGRWDRVARLMHRWSFLTGQR